MVQDLNSNLWSACKDFTILSHFFFSLFCYFKSCHTIDGQSLFHPKMTGPLVDPCSDLLSDGGSLWQRQNALITSGAVVSTHNKKVAGLIPWPGIFLSGFSLPRQDMHVNSLIYCIV